MINTIEGYTLYQIKAVSMKQNDNWTLEHDYEETWNIMGADSYAPVSYLYTSSNYKIGDVGYQLSYGYIFKVINIVKGTL